MAIVKSNPIIEGLSGKMGSFIFKNLRGKTIVARKPEPSKLQSEQQRGTRNRFKLATEFAKAMMLDPERKAHYQRAAKKLKLPNAYTAAITDYMRKPVIKNVRAHIHDNKVSVAVDVYKKNFVAVKKMTALAFGKDGSVAAEKTVHGDHFRVDLPLTVPGEHLLKLVVIVQDDAGNTVSREMLNWRLRLNVKR